MRFLEECKETFEITIDEFKTNPEFRREFAITIGKGIVGGIILGCAFAGGHKIGLKEGHSIGMKNGGKLVARWMCNTLNEYNVPMPEALRADILAGKKLPFTIK